MANLCLTREAKSQLHDNASVRGETDEHRNNIDSVVVVVVAAAAVTREELQ